MRHIPCFFLTILTCCMLLLPTSGHADPVVNQTAVQAVEKFFALIDQGLYEDSWSEAASQLQILTTAEEWIEKVGRRRTLLGHTLQRSLKSAELRSSMTGLPDGDYVIMVFDTRFQYKQEGLETITTILEDDGVWRVSGYFVR